MFGKIVVDVLLALSSAYIIYSAFFLKKGFLKRTAAIAEGTKVPSKKNLDLFVKSMYWKTLVVGIFGAVSFLLNVIDDFTLLLKEYSGVSYASILIYLVLIITYGFMSNMARNKYLVLEDEASEDRSNIEK